MAKRSSKKKTAEKKTTKTRADPNNGGNGKDTSAAVDDRAVENVNPSYDAMPNEIEDPGKVFRMAWLDSRLQTVRTQIQLVIKTFDERLRDITTRKTNDVLTLQAQERELVQALKDQRDELEKQYGIALKSYNYDDITGVLKKQVITPTPE